MALVMRRWLERIIDLALRLSQADLIFDQRLATIRSVRGVESVEPLNEIQFCLVYPVAAARSNRKPFLIISICLIFYLTISTVHSRVITVGEACTFIAVDAFFACRASAFFARYILAHTFLLRLETGPIQRRLPSSTSIDSAQRISICIPLSLWEGKDDVEGPVFSLKDHRVGRVGSGRRSFVESPADGTEYAGSSLFNAYLAVGIQFRTIKRFVGYPLTPTEGEARGARAKMKKPQKTAPRAPFYGPATPFLASLRTLDPRFLLPRHARSTSIPYLRRVLYSEAITREDTRPRGKRSNTPRIPDFSSSSLSSPLRPLNGLTSQKKMLNTRTAQNPPPSAPAFHIREFPGDFRQRNFPVLIARIYVDARCYR